jgi:hypothetical protein
LEASQHGSTKLRRLRVFNVVIATLIYCVQNAGRLFVIAWFPCLLASACRLGLEWLIFAWPPRMPEWLMANFYFDPPTWLTAFVVTPWEAMTWTFVLSYMSDRNSIRGAVTTPIARLDWVRFEFSPAVFVAAVIFSLINLVEGIAQFAQLHLLVDAHKFFELSDTELDRWAYIAVDIRVALIAMISAWLFPIAGHVLRTGAFDVVGIWRVLRGNRVRLIAISALLTMALMGLDRLVQPVTHWIAHSLDNPLRWTLQAASIRYLIDFPFSMLWTVAWAVMVGIVLDTLERQSGSAESDRPAVGAP